MSQELPFLSSSQLSDCFTSQELQQLGSQTAHDAANFLVNMSSQEFLNQLSTTLTPPNIYGDKFSMSQHSSQPKNTTTIHQQQSINNNKSDQLPNGGENYCAKNYYNGNVGQNAMQTQCKPPSQPPSRPTNQRSYSHQQQYSNYCRQRQSMPDKHSNNNNSSNCFSGPHPCDQNNNKYSSTSVAKDCFINNTKNDTGLRTAKQIQMMLYLNNCNNNAPFSPPIEVESYDVRPKPKSKKEMQHAMNLSTKRIRTSSTSTYASSPLYDSEHSSVSESCNDSDITKLFAIKEGEECDFNNREESNSPFFKREQTPPKVRSSRNKNRCDSRSNYNNAAAAAQNHENSSNRSANNANLKHYKDLSKQFESFDCTQPVDDRSLYLLDKKERNRLAAQRLRMKRRQEKTVISSQISELEEIQAKKRKQVCSLEDEIGFYRNKLKQFIKSN